MATPKDFNYYPHRFYRGLLAPGWNTPIDYDPGNLDIPIDEREEYHKQKRYVNPGFHPMDPDQPRPKSPFPQGPRPNWYEPPPHLLPTRPPTERPTYGPVGQGGGVNTWQNTWKDFRFKGV